MNRTFLERSAVLALTSGTIGLMAVVLNACAADSPGPVLDISTSGTGGAPSPTGVGGGGGKVVDVGAGGRNSELDAGPPPPIPPDDAGLEFSFPAECMSDVKDPVVLYMSSDDSNSMGSPTLAREYIRNGFEPTVSKIRTYEFLNYYSFGYKSEFPKDLTIIPEMEQLPKDSIHAEFQIGIRSFDAFETRRPMNFTFLIDTSGSMKGEGLKRAKAAVHALRSQFIQGDVVNLLTTDGSPAKLDGQVMSGNDDQTLKGVTEALTTGGDTDLYKALTDAYGLAKAHYLPERMNRVILISDGGVNVGTTDTPLIAKESADADKEGIYFVGIGTGPALSYNDELMNAVTDAGRGAYVYLDSADEAAKVLAARFDETMDIAARSVQVELTLPWYFRAKSDATEYPVSSNKVEAQHLAPNDAMVFFLNTEVCDPIVYSSNDPVRIRVFWKTRDKYEPRVTESTVGLSTLFGASPSRTMAKARAIVAFAQALKGCGVDEKGDPVCKNQTERKQKVRANLLAAQVLAEEAKKIAPDAELDEIISLIDQHPLIKP